MPPTQECCQMTSESKGHFGSEPATYILLNSISVMLFKHVCFVHEALGMLEYGSISDSLWHSAHLYTLTQFVFSSVNRCGTVYGGCSKINWNGFIILKLLIKFKCFINQYVEHIYLNKCNTLFYQIILLVSREKSFNRASSSTSPTGK